VRTLPRQGRPIRAVLLLLVVLISLVAPAACRRPAPALTNAFASPEDLAREVLARLLRRDQAALAALALTRDEFEATVWPTLPASRPETNMPLSFVWGRLKQQSDLSLAATVARHGGRAYVLQQVLFDGETTESGALRVQRESVLVVRTPEGAVERIKVFGSMLSMNGRHKVFSYVVD
jgi:hypothetical protein